MLVNLNCVSVFSFEWLNTWLPSGVINPGDAEERHMRGSDKPQVRRDVSNYSILLSLLPSGHRKNTKLCHGGRQKALIQFVLGNWGPGYPVKSDSYLP